MKGFLNPKNKQKTATRKLISNKLALRGGFGVLGTLVFTFILIAPRPVYAGFWSFLVNVLIGATFGLASALFAMVMLLVSTMIYTIAWLMRFVAEFAINMSINFEYTKGPIFRAGWPVLRDLANMSLILILVAIGIGTMLSLRLNKNRLPMFFLVAILINFTPLITGIIIDFSNIISNVFFISAKNGLSAAVGNSPINFIVDQGQLIIDSTVNNLKEGNFSLLIMGNIVMPLLAASVGIALILVFGLLAALFAGRIVALLILVILSPIAFLGLIFTGGKGRKLWDKWWSNFLQWSIIAIPLLFFLWLGGIFFNSSPIVCAPGVYEFTSETGIDPDLMKAIGLGTPEVLNSFICETFVTLFGIIAMLVGVMISFKSSAAGSQIIIKNSRKAMHYVKKKSRESAGRYSRRAMAPMMAKVGQRIDKSNLATQKVAGAPLRAVSKRVQAPLEQFTKDVKKFEQDFKKTNNFSQIRASLYSGGDKGLAAMRVAAENFPDEFAKEIAKSERLQKQFQVHRKRSSIRGDKLDEDIIKRLPHLAGSKEKIKIAKTMKYNELVGVSSKSLEDGEFVNALLENENINYSALHDVMRQSPEKRKAFLDSLQKVRDIRDPLHTKGLEDVLDEIDAGKMRNHLKDPILRNPLAAGYLKTTGEISHENIAKQAEGKMRKLEQELKNLEEETKKAQSKIRGPLIIPSGKGKRGMEQKVKNLETKRVDLENKKKRYENIAFKKSTGKKRRGSSYTNNENARNQRDAIVEEMSDIQNELTKDDLEKDDRNNLKDRLDDLKNDLGNLNI